MVNAGSVIVSIAGLKLAQKKLSRPHKNILIMKSHWTFKDNIDSTQFGFVYIITNRLNYKKYIGCKQFRFKRGKTFIESDWQTYTGSNKTLNKDIKDAGKDKFSFNIIKLCQSKIELKYQECVEIISANAIFSNNFYNEFISLKLRNNKKNKKYEQTT